MPDKTTILTRFHGRDMKIEFDNPIELSEQDRNTAIGAAMLAYGGGFIRALGNALLYADSVNTRKIKEAFPREWNEYAALAGIEA